MKSLSIALTFALQICISPLIADPATTPPPLPVDKGGIVLTFDDRNFSEWIAALPLFEKYGVKATFYISGAIDQSALDTALKLKEHGHAIGCHSIHHLSAVKYSVAHSAQDYVEKEVQPQLKAFKAAGIMPSSFAYPMSSNNKTTDEALLKIFHHIRTGAGIAAGQRISDKDAFFVATDQIAAHGCLYGKGIDYAPDRKDRTYEQIDAALARAAKEKRIIVLYAHRIATGGKGHHISPTALEHIFQSAKKLHLPFYTVDQLP
ncbi:MAG: polysaccharide deacetylase family protein [Verrucomicrobiales bacterium]|nr:polysaccharide deacetylase family protein [Verrucomicrobiales bacterium]